MDLPREAAVCGRPESVRGAWPCSGDAAEARPEQIVGSTFSLEGIVNEACSFTHLYNHAAT